MENFEKTPPQQTITETKGLTLADAKLKDLPTPIPRVVVNDLTIVDDSAKPATRQERLQEFVDGFGKAGKLYFDATNDNGRLGKFQGRVAAIYEQDHKTFKELAALTDKLTTNPPPSPEAIGADLGKTFADAISREKANGPVDLTSKENQNLMGAVSGYMLAARATFAPATEQEQTEKMVDSLEAQLQQSKLSDVHAIIWGDTKEPGMATYPPTQTYDRHRFLPPN
ncbi:MAG: hypothetical protein P4L53_02635 [Candidatus Obscuribacterales bacterium]|nr:hypothetical protein [Candidatus Obscuribacterales bacterium]